MPSTYVSQKRALLTASGTADGLAQIADTAGWLPGCTVWLSAAGVDSLECTVVEKVGTNKIRLRAKSSLARFGHSDISSYTTAKGAALDMESQVVAVNASYEPLERA